MKELSDKIKPIIEEIKSKLTGIYKDRLKGIILFGSYARGDSAEGSDIDIIILLENLTNAIQEYDRISKDICDIGFKYDTIVSIIHIDADEYNTAMFPFVLNARREGIVI